MDYPSCLDADYKSKVELLEMTQDEQGMFSTYCMASLEGLDNKQYSFNNKADVYNMAEAFILEFEEQEMNFPLHPPLIKKYQDTDKHSKLFKFQASGKDLLHISCVRINILLE
jgi:hypothetical protein